MHDDESYPCTMLQRSLSSAKKGSGGAHHRNSSVVIKHEKRQQGFATLVPGQRSFRDRSGRWARVSRYDRPPPPRSVAVRFEFIARGRDLRRCPGAGPAWPRAFAGSSGRSLRQWPVAGPGATRLTSFHRIACRGCRSPCAARTGPSTWRTRSTGCCLGQTRHRDSRTGICFVSRWLHVSYPNIGGESVRQGGKRGVAGTMW